MRTLSVILLITLVAVTADAHNVKNYTRKGKRYAKETLSKFNGIKNNRTAKDFDYVRDKLKKINEKIKAKYTLTNQQQSELNNRLKQIKLPEQMTLRKGIADINGNDAGLFEGDILLTPAQADEVEKLQTAGGSRSRRQAYRDYDYPNTIWSGPIPYVLDSSLSSHARTVIAKGIAFWEANTCIRFQQNGSGQNSIRFFSGDGCYSYVGKISQWRQQELSIGPYCDTVDTVTHEVGHALGFFHEQSRHDRDEYLTINLGNVVSGMEYNFDKETTLTNYNYEQPYDYGSVMQYGPYDFAVNEDVPTMLPKDTEYFYTIGSGTGPTFYDVLMMNKHYNCMNNCAGTSTVCYNGGYPNVNNCAVCQCPSGYGGTDCSQRTPGCGQTVTATETTATLKSALVGNGQKTFVDDISECTYWITAAANKKIEITLKEVGYVCADGCYYGGVEIKAQADQKNTGYRYCCTESEGKVLVSASNRVPIIVFNRYYYSDFTVTYRAIDAPCVDQAPADCVAYANLCNDAVYKGFMAMRCAKTCGVCSSTSGDAPNCVDLAATCTENARLCSVQIYQTVMFTQCPKTCGICTTAQSSAASGNSACADVAADCAVSAAYCNNAVYKSLMAVQCRKTCGLC